MDSMALGLLSRRESRKDLWPRLITLLLLYFMLLYSLLFAARWGFQKMLVFDTTSFSPSYSGILQFSPPIWPPYTYTHAYVV